MAGTVAQLFLGMSATPWLEPSMVAPNQNLPLPSERSPSKAGTGTISSRPGHTLTDPQFANHIVTQELDGSQEAKRTTCDVIVGD